MGTRLDVQRLRTSRAEYMIWQAVMRDEPIPRQKR